MATNDKRLRVTELDFDAIKSNLKTFLKSSNFKIDVGNFVFWSL